MQDNMPKNSDINIVSFSDRKSEKIIKELNDHLTEINKLEKFLGPENMPEELIDRSLNFKRDLLNLYLDIRKKRKELQKN